MKEHMPILRVVTYRAATVAVLIAAIPAVVALVQLRVWAQEWSEKWRHESVERAGCRENQHEAERDAKERQRLLDICMAANHEIGKAFRQMAGEP